MKILINELKKIFNLKVLIILVLFLPLFYIRFIDFYINPFEHNRPTRDEINISKNMINKFGTSMDDNEKLKLENMYADDIKKADDFLANNQTFNKFNITTYADFNEASDNLIDDTSSKFNEAMWDLYNSKDGDLFWELQTYPNIISSYENIKTTYDAYYPSGAKKIKSDEILSTGQYQSILPFSVFNNYTHLIQSVAILIILLIAFILMPLFLSDKLNNLQYLQYSAKHGRKLFKTKILAAYITAFIITTAILGGFIALYSLNGTGIFLESGINSFLNGEFWINITFKQYIIISMLSVYLLAFIATSFSMYLSNKAKTYVEAVGFQVPFVGVLSYITVYILLNNMFALHLSKYLILIIYLVLILLSIVFIMLMIKKEKLIEVN